MDKNYFIFVGIDGVLWDIHDNKYLISSESPLKKESINALNFLASSLKDMGYTPHIVITDNSQRKWVNCLDSLLSQGLTQNYPIYPLPYKANYSRGQRVSLFLNDFYNKNTTTHSPSILDAFKKNYNKKKDNYVVIEQFKSLYDNIPNNKFIQTSMYTNALSMDTIKDYIKTMSEPVQDILE